MKYNNPDMLKKMPNGKGKGWIASSGYKTIQINGKPILEHRFLMEQQLNRKLLPNENVHHINGNKLDNRIENLELWINQQPSGQRVKDLIKYAKEILSLYEPNVLK
jgi:hypothetical protein